MVLLNGLSRMRGDSHVRFLGDGGAVMRCCYPTKTNVSPTSTASDCKGSSVAAANAVRSMPR